MNLSPPDSVHSGTTSKANRPGRSAKPQEAEPAPAPGVASITHLASKLAEYLTPAELKKVKEAYRLHNMRTLSVMAPAKKRRIASETMEVYVPIAHRLGLNDIYRELQDLSFSHLYPLRYRSLSKAIKAARGNRREVVKKILDAVKTTLSA